MTTLARAVDLRLAYGDTTAVAESTFDIPFGGVTAIIGPNGSGKSTLLHALAGLVRPAGGSLEVLGRAPGATTGIISYVLQSINVPRGIPITVREAIGMGRYPNLGWFGWWSKEDRRRVDEAMAELELADLARRHLGELSGGQRQRVHVAQGIAQDHELLLLDEPLTGLDLVSAQTIDRIIHAENARGHGVVMTTHDLAEANAADFVVVMAGRVMFAGPPADVLTRTNLELAYGLGSLHAHTDTFLDDPTDQPHHR